MKILITTFLIAGFLVVAAEPVQVQAQDEQPESRERRRESSEQPRKRRRNGLNRVQFSERNTPRPGDVAPVFELESWDGKFRTRLEEFRDVRPVVLIFGSYT